MELVVQYLMLQGKRKQVKKMMEEEKIKKQVKRAREAFLERRRGRSR